MTVVNIIRKTDAVFMITDGGALTCGGAVVSAPKAWLLPHLNAVLSGRGNAEGVGLLCQTLSYNADSFDELKSRAPSVIRAVHDRHCARWQD